jgi:hypothetical protein
MIRKMIKRFTLLLTGIIFLLTIVKVNAQSDSLTVTSTLGSMYVGSTIALYQVWYKESEQTHFHLFDDSKNWLQMDKVGHFYTNYQTSSLVSQMYQWTGLERKKAMWVGLGTGFAFQTTLEVMDGFSADWGFSVSDVAANAGGALLYGLQEGFWQEQKILPKFSFYPSPYAQYRPNILGKNFSEQLLKDYNGQTYWLTFSPGNIDALNKVPKWLCLSIGYSVNEKIVGDEEVYTYQSNTELIEFNSYRQYLFSLDIDFSKIPCQRKWVKTILNQLNYLKIPFPAVSFSKEGSSFHPFYF